MESYYLQFDDMSQKGGSKRHDSMYLSEFLPLALEFYKHHVNSSDLILVNSLIRYLNVYFPNLQNSRFLVTKEQYVEHFEAERLRVQHKL